MILRCSENKAAQRQTSRSCLPAGLYISALDLGTSVPSVRSFASVPSRAGLRCTVPLPAEAKYLVNYGTRALAQFASVERLLALSALRPEEAGRA